jgi:DNA primase
VCVVEGPADLLALKQFGIPALALCGTYVASESLELLGRWSRLYVVLDDDVAGQKATARLIRTFGDRVIPVGLPLGVKDPADLAAREDGAELFHAAVRQAAQHHLGRGRAGFDDCAR